MSDSISIARPDPEPLKSEVAAFVARGTIHVVSMTGHATALESIAECRRRERRVEEAFEPARKALDLAKREVLALRDAILRPLVELRLAQGRECDDWEAEQARIAEAKRRELEAKLAEQEEERRLMDAALAEQQGDPVAAQEILDQPVILPSVVVKPEVAQVAGVSSAVRFKAEVFDLKALVLHVAARVAAGEEWWLTYLEPHLPNLNRAAVSQRENLAVPGVRAVAVTTRRVGRVG